jgi:hypothetical protein
MGKILLAIFIAFLLSFGSLFVVPINFFVSGFLKNSNFDVEYSYLEGNIFSGKILDLSYDKNFIGDFKYENQFSFKDLTLKFISIDDRDIEGKIIKEFSNISDMRSLFIQDLSVTSKISTDLIKNIDLKLNINELEMKNFKCIDIDGNLTISSQDIQEELFGKIRCAGSNDISVVLFNKRDKELGFITYKDTQAQVNISTQLIADKKIQLFMDYISFKVDL